MSLTCHSIPYRCSCYLSYTRQVRRKDFFFLEGHLNVSTHREVLCAVVKSRVDSGVRFPEYDIRDLHLISECCSSLPVKWK